MKPHMEVQSRKGVNVMSKHENERKRTFLLITIPILALFICFNTIPLIRGAMYSFTNSRGFGSHDWGFAIILTCFLTRA